MENRFLRVVVLPAAGGRIWQITYKPLAADLLWNNSAVAPAEHALHTNYDEEWSGGWDDLFPNDEAGELFGESYPDHGELWTGHWDAETCAGRRSQSFRAATLRPSPRQAVFQVVGYGAGTALALATRLPSDLQHDSIAV